MELDVALPLVVLALIDSTSIGTLLIPLWLLATPGKIRSGRIIVYLLTIAIFYYIVGIGLLSGVTALIDAAEQVGSSALVLWGQLAIGVTMFILSFRFDGSEDSEDTSKPGRLTRWRNRTTSGQTRGLTLIGLALLAGIVELATMLPYLGAIGILSSSDLNRAESVLVLAAYCGIMILPAILLLFGRVVLGRLVEPVLAAIERWMMKHAASATGWILGIAGFLITRDAVARLGLLEQWLG